MDSTMSGWREPVETEQDDFWRGPVKTERDESQYDLPKLDLLSISNTLSTTETTNRVYIQNAVFTYPTKQTVSMLPTAEQSQLARETPKSCCPTNVASAVQRKAPAESKPVENIDYAAFGKQFCQWFFQCLNSQNPILGATPQCWVPDHFWENAELKLHIFTDRQHIEEFHGAQSVSQRLLSLVKDERLLFSVVSESHDLKCEALPHGVRRVSVTGTVQQEHTHLGIFKQVVRLIHSTLEDSWKIKQVRLTLKMQN